MKRKYFFSLHLFFLCIILLCTQNIVGQTLTAKECIDMWKEKKGYHQQEVINDLFFHYDSAKYNKNASYFEHYKATHRYNPTIDANILIYTIYYQIKTAQLPDNFDRLSRKIREEIKKTAVYNDQNLLGWLYFMYAEINLRKHNVEESLFYNLKAEEIFNKLPDEAFPEKINLYHSITRALFFSREYDRAVEYGKKCEDALVKENKMASDTRIYNCDFMFVSYMYLDDYSKAEHYLNELKKAIDTYKFSPQRKNEIWQGVYNNYAGQIEMEKRNKGQALEYFLRALNLVQKNNDKSNIISLKTNIGKIYYQENRKTEAEEEWVEALKLSEELIKENSQDRKQTVKILQLLIDFYKENRNFKEAYNYSEKYNEQRSILEEQVQSASIRVAKVNIKNEFLNNEIQQYEKTIQSERMIRLATILIFILIIAGLIHIYITKKKKHALTLEINEKERMCIQEDLANAEKNIQDFKKIITSKNSIISELSSTLPAELSKSTWQKLNKYVILTDEDWEEFRIDFSKVYPMFFSSLKNHTPEITPAMLRLSALIFLQLTNDEIANCLGIDKKSVSRSIRRLRTTLKITANEDIPLWLQMVYNSYLKEQNA